MIAPNNYPPSLFPLMAGGICFSIKAVRSSFTHSLLPIAICGGSPWVLFYVDGRKLFTLCKDIPILQNTHISISSHNSTIGFF